MSGPRRSIWRLGMIAVLLGVALVIWRPWEPRLEVGGVRINPLARIDATKSYKVVVWDYELPLPWSKETHREALLRAVSAFSELYPNISVEAVMRPWDEGDNPVRDALEQGVPPDVLGMPGGVRLIARGYQVPLEHYLDAKQKQDLQTSAARAATLDHLWAFPRWISPSRWVVRVDRWPAGTTGPYGDGGDVPLALTLPQWTEALGESRTKAGGSGLAANVLDPSFFYDLLVAATGQPLLGPKGELQWPEEKIRAVAEQLRTWVERGFLSADAEAAARTRLASFWDGRALALAPANPWLIHHALQRAGVLSSPEGDPADPVLADDRAGRLETVHKTVTWSTPPQIGDKLSVAATVSGYAVFRQARYRGHDHTRAAVAVAEYLSKAMGTWEAPRIFAVPAHHSSLEAWMGASRLPAGELQALHNWSMAAVAPPVDDRVARLMWRVLQDTAVPNLVLVLKGQMSPERFAKELSSAPVPAAAEVAVP